MVKRRTIESLVLILVAQTIQKDKEPFDGDIITHQNTPHVQARFYRQTNTAFGGLVLCEHLASRLGLWNTLSGELPRGQGGFQWPTIIKSMVHGLLSGSRGTYAAEPVSGDKTLLDLLSLANGPEEATVWRALKGLGEFQLSGKLAGIQLRWTRRILNRASRRDLLYEGFIPVFADGTLL